MVHVLGPAFPIFFKAGAKNLPESPKMLAESVSYDFPSEILQKNDKFIDFLRDFVDRKCFYSTFCQKKYKKREKLKFIREFITRFQKLRQKVLEFFAESQAFWKNSLQT